MISEAQAAYAIVIFFDSAHVHAQSCPAVGFARDAGFYVTNIETELDPALVGSVAATKSGASKYEVHWCLP